MSGSVWKNGSKYVSGTGVHVHWLSAVFGVESLSRV